MVWSRDYDTKIPMKIDGSKFYNMAKGVKDYIILSGKKQFTFEEIKEIIESMAILCYTNDMIA